MTPGKRSTKAGTSAPATPVTSRSGPPTSSLKAGRSWPDRVHRTSSAQRRPGRQPRRHHGPTSPDRRNYVPAAQRRPGRQPRRHDPPSPRSRGGTSLDVSPGDTSTSDRSDQRVRPGMPLNEGRDVSPGDTCPVDHVVLATWCARSTKAGTSAPATPGDVVFGQRPGGRSTKAGTSAPATRRTSATNRQPPRAQRRPGRQPRRHC